MPRVLIVTAENNFITVVDEPSYMIFEMDYQFDMDLLYLQTESSEANSGTVYSLELNESIQEVQFIRSNNQVEIKVIVTNAETFLFISKSLKIWFPSPESGSHAFREISLEEIAPEVRFVCKVIPKNNGYCNVTFINTL